MAEWIKSKNGYMYGLEIGGLIECWVNELNNGKWLCEALIIGQESGYYANMSNPFLVLEKREFDTPQEAQKAIVRACIEKYKEILEELENVEPLVY